MLARIRSKVALRVRVRVCECAPEILSFFSFNFADCSLSTSCPRILRAKRAVRRANFFKAATKACRRLEHVAFEARSMTKQNQDARHNFARAITHEIRNAGSKRVSNELRRSLRIAEPANQIRRRRLMEPLLARAVLEFVRRHAALARKDQAAAKRIERSTRTIAMEECKRTRLSGNRPPASQLA